jgi:lipopolysaccharide transport system ATP-binding protein
VNLAIRIANLGKRYRYGGPVTASYNLRQDIMDWLLRRNVARSNDWFWALQNVSLEIEQGEAVGIIGRNGAGKSTLLKILSRITPPTTGRIEYHGRVASLLEVGTGFHRELTGRENIFLNGSILGMRRAEIAKKLDEIVAFAEVERFLDTPVKFYSSGMYVRLAFAVAAHMEPDILLVDEVLAVGDATFQRKCLGQMEAVARRGRTVLFVSHNMGLIQTLCSKAFWLSEGRLAAQGKAASVVQAYLGDVASRSARESVLTSLDGKLAIRRVTLRDEAGRDLTVVPPNQPLTIALEFAAREPVRRAHLWLAVCGQSGMMFAANMLLDGAHFDAEGEGTLLVRFENPPLLPQQSYTIRVGGRGADAREALFNPADVMSFDVVGAASDLGLRGPLADALLGTSVSLLVPYTWQLPDGRTHPVGT